MKSVKNFIADVKLSLLFTHVCPATGFCRCCAFQIGKICCQNCIVRNFQFRKFLPVNYYIRTTSVILMEIIAAIWIVLNIQFYIF